MPNHKLIIRENKWVHGGNDNDSKQRKSRRKGESALLNNKGNMCCLGHLAKSCGLYNYEIKNVYTPGTFGYDLNHKDSTLEKINNSVFKKLIFSGGDSKVCKELIAANDAYDINITQRKYKIKKLMKEIGVDVVFKAR